MSPLPAVAAAGSFYKDDHEAQNPTSGADFDIEWMSYSPPSPHSSNPTHAAALAAAKHAAAEQRVPGRTETIEYETADGKWHTETAAGSDRPETDVEG